MQLEKICPRCKDPKISGDFYSDARTRDGLSYWCKQCNRANTRDWERRNPERVRTLKRGNHLKRHYNLSQVEYDVLLAKQDGKCAVCEAIPPEGEYLHVDHDHTCCSGNDSCGKCVRGLLCGSHNRGIGLLGDNPELLRLAADYIEGWRSRFVS